MSLVLIIDSQAEVAGELADALGSRGVGASIVADGAEGLKIAKSKNPDVIVLCVELNKVSGYSICNKLKKSPTLAKIPLILTSDKATDETFESHKKLKTRAEQYLKKPYALDQMLGLIAQYIDIEAGDEGEDDFEVSIDDMDVDIDGDGDAASDDSVDLGGFDDFADDVGAGATTVMKVPPGLAAATAPDAGIAKARTKVASKSKPAAKSKARPKSGAAGGASDGQTASLREEVKGLREKVSTLEQQLQDKEQEYTDRLLEESTRGREAMELKKKLNQVDREIAKHKVAAERAEKRAQEAQAELEELRGELDGAQGERGALSDKMAQLVEKLKVLVAERDQLKDQITELESKLDGVQGEIDQAAQVRTKAKKAVDIAMQLLQEAGLS